MLVSLCFISALSSCCMIWIVGGGGGVVLATCSIRLHHRRLYPLPGGTEICRAGGGLCLPLALPDPALTLQPHLLLQGFLPPSPLISPDPPLPGNNSIVKKKPPTLQYRRCRATECILSSTRFYPDRNATQKVNLNYV